MTNHICSNMFLIPEIIFNLILVLSPHVFLQASGHVMSKTVCKSVDSSKTVVVERRRTSYTGSRDVHDVTVRDSAPVENGSIRPRMAIEESRKKATARVWQSGSGMAKRVVDMPQESKPRKETIWSAIRKET